MRKKSNTIEPFLPGAGRPRRVTERSQTSVAASENGAGLAGSTTRPDARSPKSLMKTSELETPVYFQHCPMANDGQGADWLSKESGIKNPYFGSMMLTCGKTVETLK